MLKLIGTAVIAIALATLSACSDTRSVDDPSQKAVEPSHDTSAGPNESAIETTEVEMFRHDVRDRLEHVDRRIEAVAASTEDRTSEALNNLRYRRQRLDDQLGELRAMSDHEWTSAKAKTIAAVEEIERSVDEIFKDDAPR